MSNIKSLLYYFMKKMSYQKQNIQSRQANSLETKIKILDCVQRSADHIFVDKAFGLNNEKNKNK